NPTDRDLAVDPHTLPTGVIMPSASPAVQTNPFKASDIIHKRLVWDARVHTELYSEHCHYFWLRAFQPSTQLIPTLEACLQQAGVASSCVYLLYGYWDVLIRLWATTH